MSDGSNGVFGYQVPGEVHGYNPDDMTAPLYGATIRQAAYRFFKRWNDFSGRSSRSEYWWWYLVSFVVSAIFLFLISISSVNIFSVGEDYMRASTHFSPLAIAVVLVFILWEILILIPGLSLSVRRLRDAGFRWWLIFLPLIPYVGAIAFIILMIMPTRDEPVF